MTTPALVQAGFQIAFADLAEHIARERDRAFRPRVAAGKMTQADAAHRIFVARAIAEIWRCATDGLRPNAPYMALTRAEALDDLAAAITTAERRLTRNPADRELPRTIERLSAMRWWHAFYPEPAPAPAGAFDFTPAPCGRVYALHMTLNLRFDAIQQQAQAPERKAA